MACARALHNKFYFWRQNPKLKLRNFSAESIMRKLDSISNWIGFANFKYFLNCLTLKTATKPVPSLTLGPQTVIQNTRQACRCLVHSPTKQTVSKKLRESVQTQVFVVAINLEDFGA